MSAEPSSPSERWIIDTAQQIAARGRAIGLPLIATCADLSSARPVTLYGKPVATLFEFAKDVPEYWLQSDLALHSAVVSIIRCTAEPFYYGDGTFGSWRPLRMMPDLQRQVQDTRISIKSSIIAPIHLPGGVIGAVVWATDEDGLPIRQLFEQHAADLHIAALRFISACNASMHGEPRIRAYRFTRREIQCIKLAAAGKTDEEIATILDLAAPTVRFHLKRAGEKLGENGRVRIVHHAAALGFIGMRL